MTDQPLSQEMIDALLQQAANGGSVLQDTPPEAEAEMIAEEPPAEEAKTVPAASTHTVQEAKPAAFPPLAAPQTPAPGLSMSVGAGVGAGASIDLLLDVPLQVKVELGRTSLSVREVLDLGAGSVVELERLAGEPVDLLVNDRLIARGEVVVIDESFGVRVTEITNRAANPQH